MFVHKPSAVKRTPYKSSLLLISPILTFCMQRWCGLNFSLQYSPEAGMPVFQMTIKNECTYQVLQSQKRLAVGKWTLHKALLSSGLAHQHPWHLKLLQSKCKITFTHQEIILKRNCQEQQGQNSTSVLQWTFSKANRQIQTCFLFRLKQGKMSMIHVLLSDIPSKEISV